VLDKYIGKKVRIIEHVLLWIDLGIGAVDIAATKGSIGIILSFEEYSSHLYDTLKDSWGVHPNHLAWVKSEMARGARCPVRFEEYAQPAEADFTYWEKEIGKYSISCKAGAVTILPTNSFVFLEGMI
jgi:hypothetical protein